MDRERLRLAGLGLFFAGNGYWMVVSTLFFPSPGLLNVIPFLSLGALALALGRLARNGSLGLVALGFGVALATNLSNYYFWGVSPLRYAIPQLLTEVGLVYATWSALATEGVPREASLAALGRAFLILGVAGMGWLYANVTDPGYIWIPGGLLVGGGSALLYWTLSLAPVRPTPEAAPAASP